MLQNFVTAYPPGLFVGLVALLFVAVALLSRDRGRRGRRSRGGWQPVLPSWFARKPLLSAWERSAFDVLAQQVPMGCHLCPQVRFADMLDIQVTGVQRRAAVARSSRLSVDFVVVEVVTGRALLVVELDDRSHERPERRERDRFVDAVLGHVGIPIRRFRPGARLLIRDVFSGSPGRSNDAAGSLVG